MQLYEKNSKEALFASLYRMLQIKGIDHISVDEICKGAQVSHSTFYRNFPDKFGLLEWANQRIVAMTFSLIGQGQNWHEMCLATLNMYRTHQLFYRNGVRSDDQNSLGHGIRDFEMGYYRRLLAAGEIDPDDPVNERVLEVFVQGSVSVLVQWMRTGMREEPERLVEVFYGSFPGRFRDLLDRVCVQKFDWL